MSFPPGFLDELRARLSITEVVGRRVTWDRAKTNPRRKDYWACCPFHSEKTPSFHVLETEGFYKCFSCGAGGDVITFAMEIDNLSFQDAVERLAEEAGMKLPERTPEMRRQEERRASLFDVMEMATAFYEKTLRLDAGTAARDYLHGRNLSPKVWDAFRLGYAPDGYTALSDYLLSQKVEPAQIVEAGLAYKRDNGKLNDSFRGRIMFPILDARGRVIAFGGRAMSADVAAKYKNSSETPLFHKSRTLYNIQRAQKASAQVARSENLLGLPGLVVAEGYMDVIALCLAGVPQSVAPLGTALTEEQIQLAWKMCAEPVLCFDGDSAGVKAAERAMERALPLLKAGHSLSFALLPNGLDPDDIIRERGAGAMHAILQKPVSLIDFLWQREVDRGPFETPEKRAQFEDSLEAQVRLIKDDRVARFYRQALRDRVYRHFSSQRRMGRPTAAGRAGGAGGAWSGQAGRGKPAPRTGLSSALRRSALAQASRVGNALTGGTERDLFAERERVLVATIIRFPSVLEHNSERFASLPLDRPDLDALRHEILEAAASAAEKGEALDRKALWTHLREANLASAADQLMRHAKDKHAHLLSDSAEPERAEHHWLHSLQLHVERIALEREVKEAEALFQQDESDENWQRLKAIRTQLREATALPGGDG